MAGIADKLCCVVSDVRYDMTVTAALLWLPIIGTVIPSSRDGQPAAGSKA